MYRDGRMITRRSIMALAALPLVATACTPSEMEFQVMNIAGSEPNWIADVNGYQGIAVRLEVDETDDAVTVRAFAAPDPDNGKTTADIGHMAQVPFTLSKPLGTRRFVRADGSTITPRP